MTKNAFMSWVDRLPEVGDPILKRRDAINALAERSLVLEVHSLGLRRQVEPAVARFMLDITKNWSLLDVERASQPVASADDPHALRGQDATLQTSLRRMDGMQTAAEALLAFEQARLLPEAAATLDAGHLREILHRIATWWRVAGAPVAARLERAVTLSQAPDGVPE